VIGELRDARTGRLLVARLIAADTAVARTVGLLGRTRIPDDEAMWFDRCSAVHTLGMRVAIDVVFVDEDGGVVDVACAVRPWNPWVGRRGARGLLEMAAGNAARCGISASTKLEFRWLSRT